MRLSQEQFDLILADIVMYPEATTAMIAEQNKVSERMVQRVKEAGSWQRWPWIQAKATHGYMTPEYKTYLKRRGLPLTPPVPDGLYAVPQKPTASQQPPAADYTNNRFYQTVKRILQRIR